MTNGRQTQQVPPYLASLNQEQLAAVRHSGSNLLVHAGAGSGKTRVVVARIIHHIQEQGIPPWKILAVTFTNRATHEMRERLAAALDIQQSERVLIRTFHAFGAWFLRRHALAAGLSPGFSIYDDEDSQALLKQAWTANARSRTIIGKKAKLLQSAIARAKDAGLGYESSRLASGELPRAEKLALYCGDPDFPEAFRFYQQALRRCGNADFADLLGLSTQVLERHGEIRQRMQQRFARILVDEYQDSSPLQNLLLQLLVGRPADSAAEPPPQSLPVSSPISAPVYLLSDQELCIVGDEDQSIYGFRGAEVRHILEFSQKFAPAHIVKLEQNYRSCAPILDLANQVIALNRERLGKQLRASKNGGELPQFHLFEKCEDEAVFIAQRIRERPGLRSAILYRTNAQSRTFERIFREWGIPYLLVGNLSFYRREEIKDVIAWLNILTNPRDMVSFERVYNKPKRGLGPRVLESIQAAMQQLSPNDGRGPAAGEAGEASIVAAMEMLIAQKTLASRSLQALEQLRQCYCRLQAGLGPTTELANFDDLAPENRIEDSDQQEGAGSLAANDGEGLLLVELLQEVLRHSGLLAYYQERDEQEGSERCLNFDSLLEEAQHYGRGIKTLLAFLESVKLETEELERQEETEAQREEQRRRAQRQTLITMHNTKGLEFQRVFVTGLELGIFPKFDALADTRRMEEERRLFYVAITRAEEQLYLSAARYRRLYGQTQCREISPLLREVDPAFYEDCSPQEHTGKTRRPRPAMPSTPRERVQERGEFRGQQTNRRGKSSALRDCKALSAEQLRQMAGDKKAADDSFVVGARVEHLDYGLGYVVQRKSSAKITTLMIKLDDGRLIRLQLEFQSEKLDFLGTGL